MGKETVEVPVVWLQKLIIISKTTDVPVYSTGSLYGFRADKSKLDKLKGYIESAEALLAPQNKEGKV